MTGSLHGQDVISHVTTEHRFSSIPAFLLDILVIHKILEELTLSSLNYHLCWHQWTNLQCNFKFSRWSDLWPRTALFSKLVHVHPFFHPICFVRGSRLEDQKHELLHQLGDNISSDIALRACILYTCRGLLFHFIVSLFVLFYAFVLFWVGW